MCRFSSQEVCHTHAVVQRHLPGYTITFRLTERGGGGGKCMPIFKLILAKLGEGANRIWWGCVWPIRQKYLLLASYSLHRLGYLAGILSVSMIGEIRT